MTALETRLGIAGRRIWVVGAGGGGIGTAVSAELARAGCAPIDDVRASAEYRRDMVAVLTERGVLTLAKSIGR